LPRYRVVEYKDAQGKGAYTHWHADLRRSNQKAAAKAQVLVEKLADYGTELKFPHVSHVNGPIWELRGQSGSDPVRLYYFQVSASEFMVVACEVKQQDAANPKLIEQALKAHAEYKKRSKKKGQ
jgi:putative component of toxin-antitoxin plasmid stabilization module